MSLWWWPNWFWRTIKVFFFFLLSLTTGIKDEMIWFFAFFYGNNKRYMSCTFMVDCKTFIAWKLVWNGVLLTLFASWNLDDKVKFYCLILKQILKGWKWCFLVWFVARWANFKGGFMATISCKLAKRWSLNFGLF
jgi:hypothetical protein